MQAHYCVLHGGEAVAAAATEHLIAAGVQLDEPDERGRSALHIAALVGDFATAELLVAAGAAAALPDADGATPLHACFHPRSAQQALQEAVSLCGGTQQAADSAAPTVTATPDRLAVAQLLLPHLAGGQVDAATVGERCTLLMHAAAAGSSPAVALLLSAGAARNLQDERGRTALMLAAAAGCTEAMQLLLLPAGDEPPRATAAVDLRDAEGLTALCRAVEARQRPAAELLLAAQARLDLVPHDLLAQLVGLLFAGKQASAEGRGVGAWGAAERLICAVGGGQAPAPL